MRTYVHIIYFEGRDKSETFRLPDRRMFDQFQTWLQNNCTGNWGFVFEHEGHERLINYGKVYSMTVQAVDEAEVTKTPMARPSASSYPSPYSGYSRPGGR